MKLLTVLFCLIASVVSAQDYIDSVVSTSSVTATHIDAGTISTTGNISADKFIGDGSLLTGISGGGGSPDWYDITRVPYAVEQISAGIVIGDGSGLTNLPAPSYYDLTDIPTGVANISATSLTVDELGQLQNINSVTINNTQWAYVGGLNQALATGSNVVFNNLTIGGISGTAVSVTGNVSANQFIGSGALLTNLPADSESWYEMADIPTGVSNISATALDTAELQQLQNIGTASIPSGRWSNLAHLNQSVSTTATPTFGGIVVTGNISTSLAGSGTECALLDSTGLLTRGSCPGGGGGSSDWYDLTNIPTGVQNISGTALESAELQQLQNIGTAVISSGRWTNLAHLNQSVSTTADVVFNTVSASGLTIHGNSTVRNVSATNISASTNLSVAGTLGVTGQSNLGNVSVTGIISSSGAMIAPNTIAFTCTISGTGGATKLGNGYNCGTVGRQTAGYYTFSPTTPFPNANYMPTCTAQRSAASGGLSTSESVDNVIPISTGGFAVRIVKFDFSLEDTPRLKCTVYWGDFL